LSQGEVEEYCHHNESALTLHLWHIHSPMAKLNGPMD
jgi:hypothetical protein